MRCSEEGPDKGGVDVTACGPTRKSGQTAKSSGPSAASNLVGAKVGEHRSMGDRRKDIGASLVADVDRQVADDPFREDREERDDRNGERSDLPPPVLEELDQQIAASHAMFLRW